MCTHTRTRAHTHTHTRAHTHTHRSLQVWVCAGKRVYRSTQVILVGCVCASMCICTLFVRVCVCTCGFVSMIACGLKGGAQGRQGR